MNSCFTTSYKLWQPEPSVARSKRLEGLLPLTWYNVNQMATPLTAWLEELALMITSIPFCSPNKDEITISENRITGIAKNEITKELKWDTIELLYFKTKRLRKSERVKEFLQNLTVQAFVFCLDLGKMYTLHRLLVSTYLHMGFLKKTTPVRSMQ